jgi:1-acyl-sn-glycerol-3-phosphate acyltransferase
VQQDRSVVTTTSGGAPTPDAPSAGHRSPSYRLAAGLLRGPVQAMARHRWSGLEHLPRAGGFLVASNHLSYTDPLCLGLMLHAQGLSPRFLGKAEVFGLPLVGRVLTGAGQIPVHRGTGLAGHAYIDAVAAVGAGECVVVYPEGTLTRDPEMWPMTGRTGAARIALATRAPVIPAAQWGPQQLLPPYSARLRLVPPVTVRIAVGAPVMLDDLFPQPMSAGLLAEATDRILDAITALLAGLRGEPAPGERFDPRARGVPLTGNPASGTMRRRRRRTWGRNGGRG